MKISTKIFLALAAVTGFAGTPAWADNMASIAITPATGVVTLVPRWAIGTNLAGFHQMSQDLGIGGAANNFYSIKAAAIPAGGDILAYNFYVPGSGAATPHADIGSKLTPNSYSALTSADPDVGYGSVNQYLIHHKGTTDYFSVIVPGSGTSSAVTDLKPMSAPGGPATVTGVSGYLGLTFAASNLGYGLNQFYYLRTDPVTGFTKFGSLQPALLGTATDQFNLGITGHKALAFTGTDVGYGTDKMYYLRLDSVTGYTILGTLHPVSGRASDIANLGSVFSTLTFVPGDVGFGSGNFYTTGSVNTTWQSVSFAAINDRLVSAGSFTVNPTASSALPVTLAVVAGSTGSATISSPVGGVFTVTPTAPGVITLQASQAGAASPIAYESNMLRQSFTVTGAPVITNSPLSVPGTVGTAFSFTITAQGTPTSYSASPLPAGLVINTSTGAITGTPTTVGVTSVLLGATNGLGTGNATLTVTVAAAGVAPIITNSPLTAAGTVSSAFSFAITASGTPTSYSATPLPAGLSVNTSTGAITGTPTTVGVTSVLLGATNTTGTGNATLTITVAAAGVVPIITNSPLTSAGTVGTPFGFTITASGLATSYSASPLPAGLSIVAATGVITGTPTAVGVTSVLLGATNTTGTGNATLTITVIAAAVAPTITNSPLTAAGTVGTPFGFTITASGLPTSYAASPLPAGLSIVGATGVITGTPTIVGTTVVQLSAINTTGTGNATLTITVAASGVAPIIINNPLSAAGTVGTPFGFTVVATGSPTSYSASPLPAGLSIVALTGAITGTPTAAGTTAVVLGATNASGTRTATLTITVGGANGAPVITSPTTATGTAGTPFETYVIAGTGLPTSYTATGLPAGLTLNSLTGAVTGTPTASGTYVVTITATNASGTTTATLTITVAGSRIVAFSARSQAGTGNQTLIMGFVVSGNNKTVIVRGLGTTLASQGVANALADPQLALYSGATLFSSNDDWGTGPTAAQISVVSARVGLTALATGSKDSALIEVLNNGVYTSRVSGANGTTGTALSEVYDVDSNANTRLIAVSARMQVNSGEGVLIGGLIIAGTTPKTILIRGIGPTLSALGVTGVLADPQLTVFSGTTVIGTNDDWGTGNNPAVMAAAFAQVGEFPLGPGSKDAALLLTLNPGAYTVHLSGVGGATGIALIEIYDTQ